MDSRSASRTAIVAAMMRGAHARRDPNPLIEDAWIDRLVPAAAHAAVLERAKAELAESSGSRDRSPNEIADDFLRRQAAYSNVVLRSRYSEDALEASISRGVRQYVLIGAGFDTFSLRRPAFAQGIDIYEIDHPATQALKKQRLKECGLEPERTHFIAADLGGESLRSALARSPFRFDEAAFFSWLGVTMYLTREANLATLRAIGQCAAPGSELAFTYVDESVFRGTVSAEVQELAKAVASMNEPFVSGFDPKTMDKLLLSVGLELAEDLTGPELAQRYDGRGANQFRSSILSHIALARVPASS